MEADVTLVESDDDDDDRRGGRSRFNYSLIHCHSSSGPLLSICSVYFFHSLKDVEESNFG